MKTVTVQALKSFEYQGRAYEAGQPVTMVPIEAAAHAREGNVSLQHGKLGGNLVENRQMVAEPAVVRRRPGRPRKSATPKDTAPESSARTYHRTDLTSSDDK